MSAINPVIQTPPRSNADQYNSGAGQNAAPAAQQGFSDTLNSVGAKPVRKSVSGKASHADSGGDTLPAAGNHSPHTTPPVTPAAANAVAVNAGAPANPVTSSAASTAATVAVPVTGPAAKASAGAISRCGPDSEGTCPTRVRPSLHRLPLKRRPPPTRPTQRMRVGRRHRECGR